MIDHVGFSVSDYARAKAFYERALAPLGYALIMEVTAHETGQPAAGFGSDGEPDFWIAGVLAILPIAWGAVRIRRAYVLLSRRANNQCLSCGYDLRASPTKCPECGTASSENKMIPNGPAAGN